MFLVAVVNWMTRPLTLDMKFDGSVGLGFTNAPADSEGYMGWGMYNN